MTLLNRYTGTPRRTIGDTTCHPVGLGAMLLSIEGRPDADAAVRTLHAAWDAGVDLVDTAAAYRTGAHEPGHNELLVAEALRSWDGDPESILVVTKGGRDRPGDGSWVTDGRREHLVRSAEQTRVALGVDRLALHILHAPDPRTPFEESLTAMRQLVDDGVVERVGVSNVTSAQLDVARDVLGDLLVAVQNELSPTSRGHLDVLEAAGRHGLAFLAWRPLGTVLSGSGSVAEAVRALAARRGVSAAQVALAWLLGISPAVIPIPGARRPASIVDSAAAAELELTDAESAAIVLAGTGQ